MIKSAFDLSLSLQTALFEPNLIRGTKFSLR